MLQSVGSQKAGHDLATEKQPPPVGDQQVSMPSMSFLQVLLQTLPHPHILITGPLQFSYPGSFWRALIHTVLAHSRFSIDLNSQLKK